MRRIPLSALIVAGSLILGGGIAAAQGSLPTSGSADGTSVPPSYLTDDAGRSLILRGFNTASSAKSAPDGMPKVTEADLEREHADMGTNFVAFPDLLAFGGARAGTVRPGISGPRRGPSQLVRRARLQGHARHASGRLLRPRSHQRATVATAPGNIGNGAPAWATYMDGLPVSPQDRWELYYVQPGVMRAFDNFWNTTGQHPELVEHYANAWQAVAERFAGNDTVVAYDLMNEPWGGSLQGPAFEGGPLAALYQRTHQRHQGS